MHCNYFFLFPCSKKKLNIKFNDFYTQGDDPIGPEDYEDEDDSKPEQLYGAPPGGDDQSEYSPPG